MDNVTNQPDQPCEETEHYDLQALRDALDALSPHDFAAWTAWVESRLTERLRQRQALGHATPDGAVAADAPEPPVGA